MGVHRTHLAAVEQLELSGKVFGSTRSLESAHAVLLVQYPAQRALDCDPAD